MLQKGIQGFCMALADSVPGVSGGTIAFIMGFYDQFIGAVEGLAFGSVKRKKRAFAYLVKLGIGWVIGMAASVFVLATLFESHIYGVSSLFLGFVFGAIPLICMEEKESVRDWKKGILAGIAGALLVVIITYLNGKTGAAAMDLGTFSIGLGIRLFVIGMIAISAMFLPGISGSTLLLIMGAYIPVISAVKGVLSFQLQFIPALMFFGCGVLAGACSVVKGIRIALERHRTAAVYAILGMMVGSLYAIVMGATTLAVPQPAMTLQTFQLPACIIGIGLIYGLQKLKAKGE